LIVRGRGGDCGGGVRGIAVHAIPEEAKSFTLALGFGPSRLYPMTLMVTPSDVLAAFG